jgi:hypothetical protein
LNVSLERKSCAGDGVWSDEADLTVNRGRDVAYVVAQGWEGDEGGY